MIWYTLGRRSAGYYPGEFSLFWSYKLWFDGNREYGYAILANIAMFVPFGFLVSGIMRRTGATAFLLTFLLSLGFSFLIEALQYILMRGCFEFDDICNNVSGALLGAGLFWLIRRFLPNRLFHFALVFLGTGILLCCLALFVFSDDSESGSMRPLSQGLCFQVEDASADDDTLALSGVCCWYSPRPGRFSIVLKSTQTGRAFRLNTICGLSRQDVDAYFHRDGLDAGFQAAGQGVLEKEEYEIMLDFGLLRVLQTGVYLTVGRDEDGSARHCNIHYAPNADFQPLKAEGTELKEIVESGALRVYQPDHDVYVYENGNKLYWIAGDSFAFEPDRMTRLELLLWTTETDNLSEKSKALGRLWDTYSVYFEQCELVGNFGQYRVCVWELPSDYPITSVKTGYYCNGWLWQANFWPVFRFSR